MEGGGSSSELTAQLKSRSWQAPLFAGRNREPWPQWLHWRQSEWRQVWHAFPGAAETGWRLSRRPSSPTCPRSR